ncbi:MAG TPA: zf-HC2 domain-containing protein [Planctomycetota bacterium]|nr:zf-HC2 domain-containing protein [Planctomycetota bacterium]
MKCHEAKRQLDLFMDGELSVADNMKVLEHLNLCRPCSGVYEGEKALREALRSQLGTEQAPPSVGAALSRVASPAPVLELPRRRWGAIAAAVFFLTLAAAMLFSPGAEGTRALASEVTATHDEVRLGFCGQSGPDRLCVCTHCCSEADRPIEKFFRKHVSYDVCEHDLGRLGYTSHGATVLEHRGSPVCWTILQDAKGHAITHALLVTPLALGERPLVLRSGPRPVAMVPTPGRPGFTCVFIFDDAGELDRFLDLMR